MTKKAVTPYSSYTNKQTNLSTLEIEFEDSDEEIDNMEIKKLKRRPSRTSVDFNLLKGLSPLLKPIREDESEANISEDGTIDVFNKSDEFVDNKLSKYTRSQTTKPKKSSPNKNKYSNFTSAMANSKIVLRRRRKKKFKPISNYSNSNLNIIPILLENTPKSKLDEAMTLNEELVKNNKFNPPTINDFLNCELSRISEEDKELTECQSMSYNSKDSSQKKISKYILMNRLSKSSLFKSMRKVSGHSRFSSREMDHGILKEPVSLQKLQIIEPCKEDE